MVVKQTELTDDLIKGIVRINNETPVRQGKPFWHFNKSFDEVKSANSTYPERNYFPRGLLPRMSSLASSD